MAYPVGWPATNPARPWTALTTPTNPAAHLQGVYDVSGDDVANLGNCVQELLSEWGFSSSVPEEHVQEMCVQARAAVLRNLGPRPAVTVAPCPHVAS